MKNLIILINLLVFTYQTSYGQSWPRIYDAGKTDYEGYNAIEDYDKGFLLYSLKETHKPLNSEIIKTDINGKVIWKKYTSDTNQIFWIQKVNDGILIAGITTRLIKDSYNIYIQKINNCGEVEWAT